jgi:hypothetical protein
MEPQMTDFDAFISQWCETNGWTDLQRVNGDWWAIAPSQFMPEPVCQSPQYREAMNAELMETLESAKRLISQLPEVFSAVFGADGSFARGMRDVASAFGSLNQQILPIAEEMAAYDRMQRELTAAQAARSSSAGYVDYGSYLRPTDEEIAAARSLANSEQPGDIFIGEGVCRLTDIDFSVHTGNPGLRIDESEIRELMRLAAESCNRLELNRLHTIQPLDFPYSAQVDPIEPRYRPVIENIPTTDRFRIRELVHKQAIAASPASPEPELTTQERIKQRNNRNKETMRNFLNNKIGGSKW